MLQPPESPPSARGAMQLPVESQTEGATQSLTVLQALRHVPVLSHLYGAQSFVVPLALVVVWSPSHVAPETHLPVAKSHVFPAAQSPSPAQLVLHSVGPHA